MEDYINEKYLKPKKDPVIRVGKKFQANIPLPKTESIESVKIEPKEDELFDFIKQGKKRKIEH